ncbi:MAG: monomethylamine:corrinoid methyltransferase [Atribacterota bacterium]|nr:monomethylamine:corrinoid methyltransferase [Atribacterota bacterium]
MAISIWEVIERAKNGPKMMQQDFSMNIFRACQKLVKKYDIKRDEDEIIPTDNELIRRVFEAGVELFEEVGVYHIDEGRVIHFSKDEVYEALDNLPSQVVLGEGRDASILNALCVDEGPEPSVCAGNQTILYSSEDIMFQIYKACAEHPQTDGIWGGVIPTIEGKYEVLTGTPTELWAYRKSTEILRRAINVAGRPGMYIRNNAPGVTAAIACFDRERGMRSTDYFEAHGLAELLVTTDILNRAIWAHLNHAVLDSGNYGVNGGFGGSVEGAALVTVASALQGLMVMKGVVLAPLVIPANEKSRMSRKTLWIGSIAIQALANNTHAILSYSMGDHPGSGPGTKEYFYESAAGHIAATVSGAHSQGGTRKFFIGHKEDFGTPVESWFMGQICKAAAHINRKCANNILRILLSKYEPIIKHPPEGYTINELYDLDNFVPKRSYQDLYNEVIDELFKLGLEKLKYK